QDWTFVCPTEIIAFSDRHAEFEKLGAQVNLTEDACRRHLRWHVYFIFIFILFYFILFLRTVSSVV
ncbi:unnamed protein product, partial [Discosporangium mesarthrocarpum]